MQVLDLQERRQDTLPTFLWNLLSGFLGMLYQPNDALAA
jgi:hypothetical protein